MSALLSVVHVQADSGEIETFGTVRNGEIPLIAATTTSIDDGSGMAGGPVLAVIEVTNPTTHKVAHFEIQAIVDRKGRVQLITTAALRGDGTNSKKVTAAWR